MRKTFLAVLSAIAVLGGLAVTVGTASAATPRPADRDDISCSLAAGATSCVPTGFANGIGFPAGYTAPACTPAAGLATCTEDYTGPGLGGPLGAPLGFHPGLGIGLGASLGVGAGLGAPQIMCPFGEHRWGPHCVPGPIPAPGFVGGFPAGFPGLYNGSYLNLSAFGVVGVGNVSVCSYPSWNAFSGAWSGRLGAHWTAIASRFGTNAANLWLQLRTQAHCGSSVLLPSGISLVNGSYLNLAAYGLVGAPAVSVCQYPTFNAFAGVFAPRFGGVFNPFRARFGPNALAWNAEWNALRARAACSVVVPQADVTVLPSDPSVVVQQQPQVDPTPAPAVTTPAPQAAPATPAPAASDPAPSSSSNSSAVPSGAVNTGGDDPGFLLLWPWAR